MHPPFSIEQFFDVFRRYNESVWPAQVVLCAMAIVAIVLAIKGTSRSSQGAGVILAMLWLWMAVAYHLLFFASINPAAVVFGAVFAVEAAIIAVAGVRQRQLLFRARMDVFGIIGLALVAFALIVYPMIGYAAGHRYPGVPTFGLPCPTTIFTFGMLLWLEPPIPRRVIVIPALWSVLGFSAALSLGVVEDYSLVVAGFVGTILLLLKDRRSRSSATAGSSSITPTTV